MFRIRMSVGRGRDRRTFQWPKPKLLPQAQSPLFNLPQEIRLYIYELALQVQDVPVNVEDLSKQHLSILQTCRRILHEAETMFYALHRYQYSPLVFRIGPARQDSITAVTIVTSSGASAYAAILDLHQLPNLKSLYIQRQISVRYLNISEWAVMAKQIQSELAKLPNLREIKVITPTATSELTIAENAREEKLDRVDALIERDSQAGSDENGSQ